MRALIGFGRCQIPSPDGLSCSTPIFTHAIMLHQLRANSWKYMCLRMMECLHHVTATWKILKGLNEIELRKKNFYLCKYNLPQRIYNLQSDSAKIEATTFSRG